MTNTHGILFKEDMIKAILDDRKTMTRRICKKQPSPTAEFCRYDSIGQALFTDNTCISAPYGQVGDYLYIREPYFHFGKYIKAGSTKAGKQKWRFQEAYSGRRYFVYSDNAPATQYKSRQEHNKAGNWEGMPTWYKKSPLFMPKEAARVWIRITDIRVERLQDITEEDAKAEGAQDLIFLNGYREDFQIIWQSIYGLESWDANPWVWVLCFEKCDRSAFIQNA